MPVIRLKVYNSMSDAGDICAACTEQDGRELAESDDSVMIPHPGCTCQGGCACYWTWVSRIAGEASADVRARPTKRLC